MIVWHVTMSLDGFIAGPDHAMEWAFERSEPSDLATDVMESTGAILAGRGWYDAATAKYDGVAGIYGGRWSGPVFVLTHRPADDATVAFVSDFDDALATARGAAGEKNVEIFGANVARQCLDAGVLDELVVHLAPVLLGDGVRLHGDGGRVDLETQAIVPTGQNVSLRYRVRAD